MDGTVPGAWHTYMELVMQMEGVHMLGLARKVEGGEFFFFQEGRGGGGTKKTHKPATQNEA